MNYADIKLNDVANGEGVVVSLWVSGCEHCCPGCFQEETWDINYGKPFTDKELQLILDSLNSNNIKRNFSILGGDPTHPSNRLEVHRIIKKVKAAFPDIKIWVWTGYRYETILSDFPWFLEGIDVLIDGKFIQCKRDLTLKFRGSSNQRCIDCKESLSKGYAVDYIFESN